MKRVRGGAGLGDALYMRPIVEHLIAQGEQVTVCTKYAEVFHGVACTVAPFTRERIDVLAHYTMGKANKDTTQWRDILDSAKVDPSLPLRFEWTVLNQALIDRLREQAAGKPLIVLHGGKEPLDRTDKFGIQLLPEKAAFDTVLGELKDCFVVQIGKAPQVYELPADLTLNGSTTVTDLLDIAKTCDGWVAQCSFAVPMAECFDKPALFVWASSGMVHNRHPYIQQITPRKILCKSTSGHVVDDWTPGMLKEAARAFRAVL